MASRTYPDVFWTLNDHNGLNHLFAVSTKSNGTVVTDLKLAGSENVDTDCGNTCGDERRPSPDLPPPRKQQTTKTTAKQH